VLAGRVLDTIETVVCRSNRRYWPRMGYYMSICAKIIHFENILYFPHPSSPRW